MKIGLDIRPLQGHHKVRGIGMHIHALVRWIMTEYKGDDTFVFYVYKELPNPIDDFLKSEVKYEMSYLSDYRNSIPFVPSIVTAAVAYTRRVLTPITRKEARKSDVFLGFDFMLGMPSRKDVKYALIGYDLIPLMYQREYLPNYRQARAQVGIKQAVFSQLVAILYKRAVRLLKQKNTRIISISDNSKKQFEIYANIDSQRIKTVYLGNPISKSHFKANKDDLGRVLKYKKDQFLLFIGGTDWRRRLDDLISAYNLLRARGIKLKLVFAGYDFRSKDTINDPSSKEAIINSSYSDDIELLGFINDSEKKYLYENALSFVFPSLCEGFGLPILEAMQENCPVIAYDGPLSSMREVARSGAILVKPGHKQIYKSVVDLIDMSDERRSSMENEGLSVVSQFSWDKCAEETIAALKDPEFI